VKRSNGLRRVTPLQNNTPLARHTPMRRATAPLARSALAKKAPRAKLTSRQRQPLDERSEGCCEIRLAAICTGRATDTAHRLGEGMGGRHGEAAERNDRPSNVLRACRRCHRWCHEYPALARTFGWMLRTGDDPLETPVLYRHEQWVLLADDGSLIPWDWHQEGEVS
jgi:hypothetical protein